jgi:hypothetical protein
LLWARKELARLASSPFGIKNRGTFFWINMLIFMFFIVKILPQKGQLKSSDSSRKKAASNRKRPLTIVFIWFFNKSEKQSHSAQHFCPAMTSKTPSQRFFAHAGLSKTKNCIFSNKSKVLLVYIQFLP